MISGIDVTFNGIWRVGLAGVYSQSSFKFPVLAASGTSESYHVAAYGGGQLGAWGLRGGASFSWNDVVTSRQVAVVDLANTQRGDDALKTTQVFDEVGHVYTFNSVALEPFANIVYVRVEGGINEFGLVAVSGSTKLDTAYTTLGVRGATALTQTLTARGTLGWRHALGDVTPVAALAFQSGGAQFALARSPIARDALVAEVGLDLASIPTPRWASPGVVSSPNVATTTLSRAVSTGDSESMRIHNPAKFHQSRAARRQAFSSPARLFPTFESSRDQSRLRWYLEARSCARSFLRLFH